MVQIEFITSTAVIVADAPKSRELFVDALGLPLKTGDDKEYFHSESIGGSKHFGVWPLRQAAQACFGVPDWPADRPTPQASIEFELGGADAVQPAAEELKARGFELLHDARVEPWGQTVARLQTADGCVVGLSYVPLFHAGS